MPPLQEKFALAYPKIHEHLRQEAIDEAWLKFQSSPEAFIECRRPFVEWLEQRVRGRLANLARGERRRHRREPNMDPHKLKKLCEFLLIDARARGSTGLIRIEEPTFFEKIRKFLSAADCERLDLFFDGAPLAKWVEYLGIADLPLAERRRYVRNVKHAFVQKLRRLAERLRKELTKNSDKYALVAPRRCP